MALDSYSALVGALSDWLDGTPLAGREADFITLAEDEINARLAAGIEAGRDVRPMVDRSAITIDAEYVALPDGDTVLPISIEIAGLERPWQVDFIDAISLVDQRYRQQSARCEIENIISGQPPAYFTIVGGDFRFYPAPQSNFTAEFTRYVRLPALTADAPSNWLLASHRNAYLYGALAQAELFGWNDQRVSGIATLFSNAMDGVLARYPRQASRLPARTEIPSPVQPWSFIR